MKIEFDPAKRATTLAERGLDMADVGVVFGDTHFTVVDDRRDYGETRHLTGGFLDGRMVLVAWTPRGDAVRVISLRKANGREQRDWAPLLGG